MGKKKTITTLFVLATKLAGDDNIQKAVFGQYSDGSPRSFVDALHGEYISPKDKHKLTKKKKKGKKKKNKGRKSQSKKKKHRDRISL